MADSRALSLHFPLSKMLPPGWPVGVAASAASKWLTSAEHPPETAKFLCPALSQGPKQVCPGQKVSPPTNY